MENFWVKEILVKSLYGAALMELEIKEEPGAVKIYSWGIKRKATGENLPAGITLLGFSSRLGWDARKHR